MLEDRIEKQCLSLAMTDCQICLISELRLLECQREWIVERPVQGVQTAAGRRQDRMEGEKREQVQGSNLENVEPLHMWRIAERAKGTLAQGRMIVQDSPAEGGNPPARVPLQKRMTRRLQLHDAETKAARDVASLGLLLEICLQAAGLRICVLPWETADPETRAQLACTASVERLENAIDASYQKGEAARDDQRSSSERWSLASAHRELEG